MMYELILVMKPVPKAPYSAESELARGFEKEMKESPEWRTLAVRLAKGIERRRLSAE